MRSLLIFSIAMIAVGLYFVFIGLKKKKK